MDDDDVDGGDGVGIPLDWEDLEKKSKWHLIHAYFTLCGDHPTWGPGLGGAVHIAIVVEDSAANCADDGETCKAEPLATPSTSDFEADQLHSPTLKRNRSEDSDDDADADDIATPVTPAATMKAEKKGYSSR